VPGKAAKERYDGQPLGWFVRRELQKAERVARGKTLAETSASAATRSMSSGRHRSGVVTLSSYT
jgi:hypothetical protein